MCSIKQFEDELSIAFSYEGKKKVTKTLHNKMLLLLCHIDKNVPTGWFPK